jgi:hypothetical protein
MTPSLLGLNFSIDHTADVSARDKFHNALTPAYSVAMIDSAKDASRIRTVELAYPDTTIIGRIWHKMQGGFHLKPTGAGDENKEFVASPEDIASQMDEAGYRIGIEGKSWAYVLNEPKGNDSPEVLDRLFRWNSRWLDRAIQDKRRSVMFNWGDRNPPIVNGMWDERWHGLLNRMAIYPNYFMIGMHFYGPDELASHLDAYIKTCEFLRITPLKVVATEFGVDTDAGSATNGYHSRGWSGEQMGQWIEKAITVDLAPYIKNGVLVGLQLFTWSNQPDWSAFDISQDKGLLDYLLDAKKRGVFNPPAPKLQTITVPRIDLFPSDFAMRSIERYVRSKDATQFVRIAPHVLADKVGVITSEGQRCEIIPPHALKAEEIVVDTIKGVAGNWMPIKFNTIQGWIWEGAVTTEIIPEKTITGELPKVNITQPISVTIPPPLPITLVTVPAPIVIAPLPAPVPMKELPLETLKKMKQALLDQIVVLDFYLGVLPNS